MTAIALLILAVTRGEFAYLAVGMVAGALIVYVFFNAMLRVEQNKSAAWYKETIALAEIITHLETKVDSTHWLHRSDVAVRAATKQRFFDAYEELVEQRKVIRISNVEADTDGS